MVAQSSFKSREVESRRVTRRREPQLVLVRDAPQAAKSAGLRYAPDAAPGIVRRRVGKGFSYVGPDGHVAATVLRELPAFETQAGAKRNVVEAIRRVSQKLGNTPAVCRRSYVHPAILDGYVAGELVAALEKAGDAVAAPSGHALRREERAVVAYLEQLAPRR